MFVTTGTMLNFNDVNNAHRLKKSYLQTDLKKRSEGRISHKIPSRSANFMSEKIDITMESQVINGMSFEIFSRSSQKIW